MKKRISYILLFVATVLWGLAFVAQKAAAVLPPFIIGAIRSGMAVLFITLLIPATDRLFKNGRSLLTKKNLPDISRRELIGGCILGVLLTVATTFQQYGIGEGTDAGKAAFITALYVVIVPLLSALLGKRPGLLAIISIPLAVVGFYVLCIEPGSKFVIPDLIILLCAAILAFHIISVDRFSAGCDGVRISLVQFIVSFILNTVFAFIFEVHTADLTGIADVLPALVYLGIGSSGVAYTLQIVGQKNADPTVASLIMSMEAVVGVIGAAIFLGERMSLREYIGCAIVLSAVVLAQINPAAIKSILKRRGERDKIDE